MNETPFDEENLAEMIRHIIRMSGNRQPVIIGIQIIIPGTPDGAPLISRGDGTEPPIEVQTIGERVVLSTELPGIAPGQVQVMFREDRVFIWAKDQDRHYTANAAVPPALKDSIEISFHHGVLEVSYLPVDAPVDTP
ncbi:MAG: hypothetical protein WC382_03430 [Methanoregulaceae archaeon]|jgi:hypothetical protein